MGSDLIPALRDQAMHMCRIIKRMGKRQHQFGQIDRGSGLARRCLGLVDGLGECFVDRFDLRMRGYGAASCLAVMRVLASRTAAAGGGLCQRAAMCRSGRIR
jgi:hypothetical protein